MVIAPLIQQPVRRQRENLDEVLSERDLLEDLPGVLEPAGVVNLCSHRPRTGDSSLDWFRRFFPCRGSIRYDRGCNVGTESGGHPITSMQQ
jgi:hypothetical protein